MSKIKWIQLSDLHLGNDSAFSEKSRKALLNYIREHDKEIDFVFITGDIIYAKNLKTEKEKKNAYYAAEEYIKELYSLIWEDDKLFENLYKRVFIVPGNHDIMRNTARTSCINGLRENYAQDMSGNIDSSFIENTLTSMKCYKSFYNKITGLKFRKKINNMHYVFETDKINVLHINTCIASCGDSDDGKLILGFKLLNNVIEEINNNKPTIAIAHHNFDCFEKSEQKNIEILLKEKNIFLYLCGHAHERESNLVLRYNQMKMLNTFTCGTLLSTDGENKMNDTVFFRGELDTLSCEGIIKSYKWTLDNGWHEDTDFGLVQKNTSNFRTFMNETALNGRTFPVIIEGDGAVAQIVSNQSSERNIAFYEMNKRVENSLSIYGVGITNVSRNTELFDKILDRGGTVRLCMVNPCVLKVKNCLNTKVTEVDKEWCDIEDTNFCIYANHIEQYVRKEYYEDIKRSYKRIKEYKEITKEKAGNFEVKLLKSFIPMSINIINENTKKAELIIEYNMPFTSKRLMLSLNIEKHPNYYAQVKNVFDDIWNKAEELD